MLENINLKKKVPREEYKRILPGLQGRLYDLEKACWDLRVPSVIVFEGWDASGKGTTIAALTQRLDPAPWCLVEGNDKYWARAKVLSRLVEILSAELEHKPADPLRGKNTRRKKSQAGRT